MSEKRCVAVTNTYHAHNGEKADEYTHIGNGTVDFTEIHRAGHGRAISDPSGRRSQSVSALVSGEIHGRSQAVLRGTVRADLCPAPRVCLCDLSERAQHPNWLHKRGYGRTSRFRLWASKEYWHKGIVTEAGRAVIAQVKKDGLPYITATHDRNNPRSGGVMRNVGMKYQYSYEEQWQPKNILVTFRMYQLNLDGEKDRVYKKYWDSSDVHFIEAGIL